MNIGKSRVTPAEQAIGDYIRTAERLGAAGRLPGGQRQLPQHPRPALLQQVQTLRGLLAGRAPALDAIAARTGRQRRVPLLVKIDPDLPDADIDAIADLALELGLDGIIATNTTIAPRPPALAERLARAIRRAGGLGRPAQGAIAGGAAPAARPGGRSASS